MGLLHKAAQACDVEALKQCLTKEALDAYPIYAWTIVSQHGPGREYKLHAATALHALCFYEGESNADIEECVKLLLEAGADLEARDHRGRTPLHVIATVSGLFGGSRELAPRLEFIAAVLLRQGANVNTRDNENCTPLHAARFRASIASLLLKAGAAVDVRNANDWTPLDVAILCPMVGSGRVMPILLRYGAELKSNTWITDHVPDDWQQGDAISYLRRVLDGGGFKRYEQAHLAKLTKAFEPKLPVLPKELVRRVMEFWLHAGFY